LGDGKSQSTDCDESQFTITTPAIDGMR